MFLLFKKSENQKTNNLLRIFYYLLSAGFILLGIEAVHLSSLPNFVMFFSNWYWIIKVLISYLFVLSVFSATTLIVRNEFLGYIISAVIFYIFTVVTFVMLEITGDPLLPSDLFLAKNISEISSFVNITIDIAYILSFFIMLIGGILLLFSKKTYTFKSSKPVLLNIFGVVFSVFVIYSVCFNTFFRHEILKSADVKISAFNPVENLRANGPVLTFFPRIGDLIVKTPSGYSDKKIEEIKNGFTDVPENFAVTPDVFVIQNESWWDPTLLKNVNFSDDPMKEIKKLSEKFPSGNFVSSVFSGSTCIPEFEFLTGFSTAFMPANSYPYIQYVLKDTESIVWTYKNNGFETVAVHPYKKRFYNRDTAYPLLGFDTFLSISDIENAKNYEDGWYISDDYVSDQLISVFENKKKENLFCFAVTMQNHGGYNPKRYDNYDIDVTSDVLSKLDLQGLSDYTQGVKDASDSFIKLTEYFSNVSSPVLLVMYGDHLPLLGTEGSTYVAGEMAPKGREFNPVETDELYYTPYIVWANYDISDLDLPKYVSPGNLGLSILKFSGLKNIPWYQSYMKSFYDKYPVYSANIRMDSDLNKITNVEEAKDFELVQYDLLHAR